MEEISLDTLELGNLFWGHSRGKFSMPRGKWQDKFHEFLEACGFDSYGHLENDKLEKDYIKTECGIAYRSNDCDAEIENVLNFGNPIVLEDGDRAYEINGQKYIIFDIAGPEYDEAWEAWNVEYDQYFEESLKNATEEEIDGDQILSEIISRQPRAEDFPQVKKIEQLSEYTEHRHYFANSVFELRPYYWGDSAKLCAKPNFIYHPKNIEISWYKYPLRDSYCSHDISYEEFIEMLRDCARSLNIIIF